MNLNVIHELRDRLESISIAGLGLIKEDFRLKRNIEKLEEYVSIAPVFKQIYELAKKLQSDECTQKADVLLDLIALTDALLCTQASYCTEGEEVKKSELSKEKFLYQDIPYSKLKPIIESFMGSGSGRYAIIRDNMEASPDLFKDIRIKRLMIKALGDSYAELAQLVETKLCDEDKNIVPLLKKDFDKEGSKEMVRRVRIIAHIMKEEDNDFYISLLEGSSKEIKEEAIRALRFDKSNVDLLLDLAKTEKGKLKEAVNESISHMSGKKVIEYWTKLSVSKAVEAAKNLVNQTSDWAADIVADMIEKFLEKNDLENAKTKEEQQKIKNDLAVIWRAGVFKKSKRIEALYDKVYKLVPEQVVESLVLQIYKKPSDHLYELSKELYKKHGKDFLKPLFISALFFESKESLYDEYHKHLEEIKKSNISNNIVLNELMKMAYDEDKKKYIYMNYMYSNMYPYYRSYDYNSGSHVIEAGFDERWYKTLFDLYDKYGSAYKTYYSRYSNPFSEFLAKIYNPDLGLDEMYGEHFYNNIKNIGPTTADIQMLQRCNWTYYEGIFDKAESNYVIRNILNNVEFDKDFVIKQLDRLISDKSINKKINLKTLKEWKEQLEGGMSYDMLSY